MAQMTDQKTTHCWCICCSQAQRCHCH